MNDCRDSARLYSYSTYRRLFGGLPQAFAAAGLGLRLAQERKALSPFEPDVQVGKIKRTGDTAYFRSTRPDEVAPVVLPAL